MTYLPVSLNLKDSHGKMPTFTYITIVASAENFTGIVHKNFYTTVRTEIIISPLSVFPCLSRILMVGMHVPTVTASAGRIIGVVPKNPL